MWPSRSERCTLRVFGPKRAVGWRSGEVFAAKFHLAKMPGARKATFTPMMLGTRPCHCLSPSGPVQVEAFVPAGEPELRQANHRVVQQSPPLGRLLNTSLPRDSPSLAQSKLSKLRISECEPGNHGKVPRLGAPRFLATACPAARPCWARHCRRSTGLKNWSAVLI